MAMKVKCQHDSRTLIRGGFPVATPAELLKPQRRSQNTKEIPKTAQQCSETAATVRTAARFLALSLSS